MGQFGELVHSQTATIGIGCWSEPAEQIFDHTAAAAVAMDRAVVELQLSTLLKAKSYPKAGMIGGTAIGMFVHEGFFLWETGVGP